MQANELITTRANDRAHLMFLDGTSVTVGPNAQLTIDRFVYDPNTYDPQNVTGLTLEQEAEDAEIIVDGITVTKDTDRVMWPVVQRAVSFDFYKIHERVNDGIRNWSEAA